MFSDNCITNVKPKHIFEFVVSTNTFNLMLRLDLIPPYQVYHFFFFILRSSPKQLYNAGTKSMIVYLFFFFQISLSIRLCSLFKGIVLVEFKQYEIRIKYIISIFLYFILCCMFNIQPQISILKGHIKQVNISP